MAKRYNSSWNAKRLTINFTQKQWRQDFAAYVKEKLFWDMALVTRAIVINNIESEEKIKEFIVYNNIGEHISVKFCNENKVISCSLPAIINNYLKEKIFLTKY